MAIKCDETMKRSKEKCWIITGTGKRYRWRCTRKCEECICGMTKLEDGTQMHVRIRK